MTLRLDKFHELLQDCSLYHPYHPTLIENGFDNWEAVSDLNAEILHSIGITNETAVKEILTCVEAAREMKDEEEVLNESAENLKIEGDLIEEIRHGEFEPAERKLSQEVLAKKQLTITESMLLKGTTLKKDKKETNEKFLSKVIQLHLNEKGISHIDNLHLCPNVQGLFLYNNCIERIEKLDALSNLTQLNLQGNFIRRIENLNKLTKLKKLTLSKNMISVVEGLEYCQDLEELYISHQHINTDLKFDLTSMAVISGSLRVLEADSDKIIDVSPLAYLSNMQSLSLRGNDIRDIESIEKVLACMNYVAKLDIRDNPVDKVPKVRDQIVLMAPNLGLLNDKKILENERAFLLKFYNIKSAQQGKGKNPNSPKRSKTGPVDLTVAGNSIQEVGKENLKLNDGLNRPQEFYSNTVHKLSKKSTLE